MEKVCNDRCCGCGACKAVCPVQCISMEEGKGGFLYPVIDKDRCIECNKCKNVCPVLVVKKNTYEKKFYAGASRNHDLIINSSSGGILAELSQQVISDGGVVYGCTYDENLRAVHKMADNLDSLKSFQGSKYLQSDVGDTYNDCKRKLDEGIAVLYTGTPCQIAGLKNYLKKEYDCLLTAELICHGVPSYKLWRSYVDKLEKRYGKKIVDINQRYKDKGWRNYRLWIRFEDNEEIVLDEWNEPYFRAFTKELSMRQSCYSCKHRIQYSQSDFLVGDFWGIENYEYQLDLFKGVSFVAILSQKGEKACTRLDSIFLPAKLEQVIPRNACITSSAFPHRRTREFYEGFDRNEDITVLVNKYENNYNWDGKQPKFALWGSYNVRLIARFLQNMSDDVIFHMSNSSVVSAMEERIINIPNINLENTYRKSAIINDFEGGFGRVNERINDDTYFIMDLLEERFELCKYEDKIVTVSNAFCDVRSQLTGKVEKIEESFNRIPALNNFIRSLVNKYSEKRIIIIEDYLCERYLNDAKINSFEDNNIKLINSRLKKLYDFIKSNFTEILFVSVEESELFADMNHRYGLLPENLSYYSCYLFSDKIYKNVKK